VGWGPAARCENRRPCALHLPPSCPPWVPAPLLLARHLAPARGGGSWVCPCGRGSLAVAERHLPALQWHSLPLQFCLLGALLAPVRVLLAFIVLFLLWPFAWLQVAGLTEEQLQEPITGWRKTVCHNGVLGLSRLLFFLLGFLRIRVRGQRASRLQAPVLVAAPHSTFFDPIVLLPCDLPKVVSRAENLSVPVIGALLRFNQAILVSRHDPASRRRVVEEVRRRATSGGKWPQVLFFPEGTCSNKKALLKFKPGAFIAGVPVQPVLIRYPNGLDTTSWAWRGPGVLKVLWLTASQPCSVVDVEFLPVYHPSPEESRDPTLYANNVQRVMAQALGIPATECEFVGSLPVIVVGRLKVALEPQLWELGKVLRKAGLSPGRVDAGAEPGRSRMISQEEFARQLQLSDPQTVAGAFSYFQQDAQGLVDFRDVALALAALDGGRSLEELTRLAFEVSSRTSPSMTHSMGSCSAPTCAPHTPLEAPPRCNVPRPQAAPLLWPMALYRRPSRRVTEHLSPYPHLRGLHPAPHTQGSARGLPYASTPILLLFDFCYCCLFEVDFNFLFVWVFL
uniref:Lysophosphatidylcholine acyltransferase 4 n=1 Tax=Oryctolagus cuniculus TaxID=9986 RepID=A0A5F9DQV2_RABIT